MPAAYRQGDGADASRLITCGAVVGAGTMGSQIGLVFADGGFETLLYDLMNEHLDRSMKNIKNILDRKTGKGVYDYGGGKCVLP